jgi:hypothetical protein
MIDHENNNSSSGRSRIKDEDIATLMEVAGVSEDNARELLMQAGDVQSVLKFMFG